MAKPVFEPERNNGAIVEEGKKDTQPVISAEKAMGEQAEVKMT